MRTNISEKERIALIALRDNVVKSEHRSAIAILSATTLYVEMISINDPTRGPGIGFQITQLGIEFLK